MIVDTPEQTDGYRGLHGEVVLCDTYRVGLLPFVPDVVLDLGANIGIFTRYARALWPNALIVAVEPDLENFTHLKKFTPADPRTELVKAAIGTGPVWKHVNAPNGAHGCYLCLAPGYPNSYFVGNNDVLSVPGIPTVMPDDLIARWSKPADRLMVKMDIEGAENAVFGHPPSMAALARADYIAGELHRYAANGSLIPEVNALTDAALDFLRQTHDVETHHVNFWATKR